MDIHIFELAHTGIKESSYIPLNVMSEYSIGKSIVKIDNLIQRAKSLNMKALALTDKTLAGALEFYQKCIANGIKPIIGQKIYFLSSGIILLCKDFEGYKILCQHSLEFLNQIELYNELPLTEEECKHFICITEEYTNSYLRRIFGSDLYAELPFYKLNANKDFCERSFSYCNSIPAVITNEVHFFDSSDSKTLNVFIKAKNGYDQDERPQFYFTDDSEILPFVEKINHLELVDNIQKIVEQIPYIFPENYFDTYDSIKRMMENLPEFEDGENLLKELVAEGIQKRKLEKFPELVGRVEFELSDIISHKWTNLFLMQWELTSWCRENNIAYGPGRGAAGGSLVAYLLQITDINPLEYGLLYERFINPDRITYPDFDIDYDYEHVEDIVRHLKDKYGRDNVARIATYGRISARTAIEIAGKGLGFPEDEIMSISKLIPTHSKITMEKMLNGRCFLNSPDEIGPYWYIPWWDGVKIKNFLRNKKYEKLIIGAKKLEGLINNQNLHACGYIITKEPVCNYAPVSESKSGELYCEYTIDEIDLSGLYKNDILGLLELSKLEKINKLINKTDFDYHNIPLDDAKTMKAFAKGKTDDVFQFESPGMQKILREVKPENFENLIALNALYLPGLRPGLMDYIPYFIDSKLKPETIHYPDSCLENILKETYGIIVYQEQLMQIIQKIAGFSLSEADMLRRAMGRKKPDVLIQKKSDFIIAAQKRGFTEQNASQIFEIMIPFASYAFNKSHSTAYTKMAFWDMYLKVHYNKEYETVMENMREIWDKIEDFDD